MLNILAITHETNVTGDEATRAQFRLCTALVDRTIDLRQQLTEATEIGLPTDMLRVELDVAVQRHTAEIGIYNQMTSRTV